jgi:hypothetical protein
VAGLVVAVLRAVHRGLANLASRADARGGHCSLRSDERTTVLTWTARLDQ